MVKDKRWQWIEEKLQQPSFPRICEVDPKVKTKIWCV